MGRKLTAEFYGTLWLVLGGCGTAVLAAGPASGNVGVLGVSVAFGLTVLTMAYAIGHISGCHLNPAVTLGLVAAGRHPTKEAGPYIIAQVLGALAGAGLIFVIVKGRGGGFDLVDGALASNGFEERSPFKAQFSMVSALVTEFAMTFFFLLIIIGATDRFASPGMAGLAIGLGLTLIHLISIPVTNTSVNPARSTGPAVFEGAAALGQLWLFWVAPIAGAVTAGVVYKVALQESSEES